MSTNNAVLPTFRDSGQTVEYPDVIEGNDGAIIVTFDPGNANSPNNSQQGGDGNWIPFGDNTTSITNNFSTTVDGLELSISASTDSGTGNWGINSQGLGIFSPSEGSNSAARRINGALGESLILTFDQDVHLRSLRLGNFNAGEQFLLLGEDIDFAVTSNAEGPTFNYSLQGLFLPSGTSIQLTSNDDDFLFNEISVDVAALVKGDVNLDGQVNLLDVAPFVDLISSGQFQQEADVNCDGEVNLLDVSPLIQLLSGA